MRFNLNFTTDMQNSTISLPACFTLAKKSLQDPGTAAARPGQSMVTAVYLTKVAGHCRAITVTWSRHLLVHALAVSIENAGEAKVELRPWYFWRRQGSKRFAVGDAAVYVFWDLKNAKFRSDPEPASGHFVAVVCNDEFVLLLGDLKKEAYWRTGARPSPIDATLVSKKEHVFGKKRFTTRFKVHEKGHLHEICIELRKKKGTTAPAGGDLPELVDPEMVVKLDGQVVVHVKHLQWKFRGNESIFVYKNRVELYWDAHDWLFNSGLRHALFIFKPSSSAAASPLSSCSLSSASSPPCSHQTTGSTGGKWYSGFSLFLYAWRLD